MAVQPSPTAKLKTEGRPNEKTVHGRIDQVDERHLQTLHHAAESVYVHACPFRNCHAGFFWHGAFAGGEFHFVPLLLE
jgi:hypothetical protein